MLISSIRKRLLTTKHAFLRTKKGQKTYKNTDADARDINSLRFEVPFFLLLPDLGVGLAKNTLFLSQKYKNKLL